MDGDISTGDRATAARDAGPSASRPDDAVQMTVVALTQCGALCRDAAGIDQRVEIELVEPVGVGELLLVRAGVAVANRRSGPGHSVT
jgi:hypothetical protein